MKKRVLSSLCCLVGAAMGLAPLCLLAEQVDFTRHTQVSMKGEDFLINGTPTFQGESWRGYSIEGLLPNSRMVNGIFDDENPETQHLWAYPDTGKWDAERNVTEFIASMPLWREKGLLAFTINLQGGSPQGYSQQQTWCNTALTPKGELKAAYMNRLERVLDKADELGMVVILGIYYFGQEKYMDDEAAILKGIENSVLWVLKKGYGNVMIEIVNECEFYKNPILKPSGIHRAIAFAKSLSHEGRRLLISTSYGGGGLPSDKVVAEADFLLLHGNGISNPDKLVDLIRRARAIKTYTPRPIIINEDDHYDFEKDWNNFAAATSEGASWGFFDYRRANEAFSEGYQCIPADWGIESERKKAFFKAVSEWGKK